MGGAAVHPLAVAAILDRPCLWLDAFRRHPPLPPHLGRSAAQKWQVHQALRRRPVPVPRRRRGWPGGLHRRHQTGPGEDHPRRSRSDGGQQPAPAAQHQRPAGRAVRARQGRCVQAPGPRQQVARRPQPAWRDLRRSSRHAGRRDHRCDPLRHRRPPPVADVDDHHRRRQPARPRLRAARLRREGARGRLR
ncbi:hypothetical protein D9M68_673570 [compost metagenome]